MGRFKTKKTSEYNRIIIMDQESYQIFLNDLLSSNIKFMAKANEDQKWSLHLHKKFFLNFQNAAFLGFYLTFEINLLNSLQ